MSTRKNGLREIASSPVPRDALEDAIRAMAAPAPKEEYKARPAPSALGWFSGIKPDGNEAQNVAARALLLVADSMTDVRGRVLVADLMSVFPRAAISPCIQILRAQNLASSDGRSLTIARSPVDERSKNAKESQ